MPCCFAWFGKDHQEWPQDGHQDGHQDGEQPPPEIGFEAHLAASQVKDYQQGHSQQANKKDDPHDLSCKGHTLTLYNILSWNASSKNKNLSNPLVFHLSELVGFVEADFVRYKTEPNDMQPSLVARDPPILPAREHRHTYASRIVILYLGIGCRGLEA